MKKRGIVIVCMFSLFFIAVILLTLRAKRIAIKENFKGVVKKASIYGGKGDIKVWLNDRSSHILDLYGVKKEDNIHVGDSLYKEAGSPWLYHYKKDSLGNYYLYRSHVWSMAL
ncbi:hypothetical protein LS482_09645 [Sinomicrobium kalidii]|uniref:hypothetical protein n=1 Tax=Sinomicrobium kalidii TaxID=2900738 RepID=UPI001E41FB2A|nr:hypothetical protein [Sinomicrobium kalidii]UGU18130.1 hypothetical protein LS482_09645 [Sinomicrobium kalidii]